MSDMKKQLTEALDNHKILMTEHGKLKDERDKLREELHEIAGVVMAAGQDVTDNLKESIEMLIAEDRSKINQLRAELRDKFKEYAETYLTNKRLRAELASRAHDILSSHGMYGDSGNLDKLTRAKCIEIIDILTPTAGEKPKIQPLFPDQIHYQVAPTATELKNHMRNEVQEWREFVGNGETLVYNGDQVEGENGEWRQISVSSYKSTLGIRYRTRRPLPAKTVPLEAGDIPPGTCIRGVSWPEGYYVPIVPVRSITGQLKIRLLCKVGFEMPEVVEPEYLKQFLINRNDGNGWDYVCKEGK